MSYNNPPAPEPGYGKPPAPEPGYGGGGGGGGGYPTPPYVPPTPPKPKPPAYSFPCILGVICLAFLTVFFGVWAGEEAFWKNHDVDPPAGGSVSFTCPNGENVACEAGTQGCSEALMCKDKAKASKPHIVIALVDDLGWDEFDIHGIKQTDQDPKTPIVHNLAVNEGIILNRMYSYNWCGPSRSSLMTGRIPTNVYYTNVDSLSVNPANPFTAAGASANMSMISDHMQAAGYKTVYRGKWGAGYTTNAHLPLNRGYDEYIGFLADANDYWAFDRDKSSATAPGVCERNGFALKDFWGGPGNPNGPGITGNNTVWEDYYFEQESIKTIVDHNTSIPLFLFHAFHSIHTPLDPPSQMQEAWYPDVKDNTKRAYMTMVQYVDQAIGNIVDALKQKQMWENTIMLVASDNGGPLYMGNSARIFGGANNYPLRGSKTSDWEGGIRVTAFMTGGFVPKARRGIKLDGYAHFADILATFSTLAGYDPTDYKAKEATKKGNPNNLPYNADATTPQTQTLSIPPIDSLDLWPYLMGEEASSPRTGWLQSDKTAIKGDYKIIFGNGGSIEKVFKKKANGDPSPLEKIMPAGGLMKFDTVNVAGYGMGAIQTTFQSGRNCSHGCLFNIQTDPTELYDISGSGYSQDTRGGCIGTTKDTCDPTWVNIPAAGAPAAEPAVHKEMTKFYNEQIKINMWVVNRVGQGDSVAVVDSINKTCEALQIYGGGPGEGFQAPFYPAISYPKIALPMPPKTETCKSMLPNDAAHLRFCFDGTEPRTPKNPLSLLPGIGFTWGCAITEDPVKLPMEGKWAKIGGQVLSVVKGYTTTERGTYCTKVYAEQDLGHNL